MKKTGKYTFALLCLAVVLISLSGAVIKHTLLKDERVELLWKYRATYTVEVTDVPDQQADMYFEGMLLLLDESTPAGDVEEVETGPAASGKADCKDITLTVNAAAYGTSEEAPPACTFTRDNEVQFISRFIDFTGTITGIIED